MLLFVTMLLVQAQPQEPKKEVTVELDRDGLHVKSADEQFTLNVGGRYQVIGRIVEGRDSDRSGNANADSFRENGFFTRSARIDLWGTFSKIWEYKVSADLVTTTPTLADGYVGYIGTRWLMVRMGQMKTPQGIEQPGSTLYTTMVERYPGDAILPGRDLGIKVHGYFLDDAFYYELMFSNGSVAADQNKGIGTAGPNDDELDFLMQITLAAGRILDVDLFKKLVCGYFHQTGEATELALPDLRTRDTGTKILDFNNDSTSPGAPSPAGTVVQDGQRERDGVFFAWPIENFGIQGEWARLDCTILNLGGPLGRHTIWIWAWFVDVCWIVTGEEKAFNKRIVPLSPLHEGGPGAFELALRFGQWQTDDSIEPWLEGFAFPERVTNHTVGVNWWPHSNVRVSLNYVHNTFKGRLHFPDGDIRAENAVLIRAQFGF